MSQKNKVSVTRDKGKSYSSLNLGNPNLDSWIIKANVRMSQKNKVSVTREKGKSYSSLNP
jgi:hypothetical protein